VVQKNASSQKPGPTQAQNLQNLVAVLKRTDHMDSNLQNVKDFLKEDPDLVNPATKRCIEESASFKFGGQGAFSLANSVYNPKEFFSKLNTDNTTNASDVPKETLTIGGGEIFDNLNNAAGDLLGSAGAQAGAFMQ